MPTTKTYTTYKFDELPKEVQSIAISNLYTINVEHDWYDVIYEDASNIHLKITAFDADRGSYIKWDRQRSFEEVADAILGNHGEVCETYNLAKKYLEDLKAIESEEEKGNNPTDSLDAIDGEFEYALKEEYLSMLRKEYEYQTSEEAIKETILANDYDFTIDGKIG